MNENYNKLTSVDRVIYEPTRLMLLTILYSVESADFLYLLRETDLTRGNLSTHLSRLEEAGYLEIEKTYRGKIPQTLCRMTEKGRESYKAHRAHLKQIIETMNVIEGETNGKSE